MLELHDGSANIIATNDDWKIDGSTGQSSNRRLKQHHPAESALIVNLDSGESACTAIVRGKNNGTGIELAEVYDLERLPISRLGNISTRGFVEAGDNVRIGGFIAGRGEGTSYFLRALAPSLQVNGALQDSSLEVHDTYGDVIASNDNWKIDDTSGESQEQTIRGSAFQPQYDSESALIYGFGPRSYTVIVCGRNNTSGVASAEVYEFE